MKKVAIIVSAVAFVLTMDYRSSGQKLPSSHHLASSSIQGLTKQQILQREALQFGRAYWEKILTKCGTSYYWKHAEGNGQYFEAQTQPTITLVQGFYIPPKQLTRAEQLNNEDPHPTEFQGVIRLTFETFRADGSPTALTGRRWREGFLEDMRIYKNKGRWVTGAGAADPLRSVTCSELAGERQKRRGIELGYYCGRKFGSSAVETVTPGDAFSWQCKNREGSFKVNMDQACEWQYGDLFKATYDDSKDHKSWHCVLKSAAGKSSKALSPTPPTPSPTAVVTMVKDYEVWGGGRGREWEVSVPKTGMWVSTEIPVSVNQDIFILSPLLSPNATFSMQLGDQVIQSEFNETTRQGWIARANLREQASGGGKARWAVPSGWNGVIRLKVESQVEATALNLRVSVSDVSPTRREGDKNIALATIGRADGQQISNAPPRIKRNSVSTVDVYSVRVFNCDDRCRATVNGSLVVETGFGEDSGWIAVTDKLKASGNNINFQVINDRGAIVYGFQVRKNEEIVFQNSCGTIRVVGCENNREDFPVGVAREFVYNVDRGISRMF